MIINTKTIHIKLFLLALSVILFEVSLTRIFAVTLFANYANLVIGLGIFGFSIGAIVTSFIKVDSDKSNFSKILNYGLLSQALFYLAVLWLATSLQIYSSDSPNSFAYQSRIDQILIGWKTLEFYILFLSVLLTFSLSGGLICLIFKHCAKNSSVGVLYAYDLVGAGIGAFMFLFLSNTLTSPQLIILSSIFVYCSYFFDKFQISIKSVTTYLIPMLILTLLLFDNQIFKVKHAAGLPENSVFYEQWTPVSRITLHHDSRGPDRKIMVFDSASVSVVVNNDSVRNKISREATRSIVYRISPTESKVAILAASAGPEVAIAQKFGFKDITAIDINGKGFDIIKEQFKSYPNNPFLQPGVKTLDADGRAGVLMSKDKFDIIQMVHANLWSVAGILSTAWSPWNLTTVESFQEYFSKLNPDGMLSFSKGLETEIFLPTIIATLKKQNIILPYTHVAFFKLGGYVLLVRPRPWTEKDLLQLEDSFKNYPNFKPEWIIHPSKFETHQSFKDKWFGVITDDRPYPEKPGKFFNTLKSTWYSYFGNDPWNPFNDPTTFIYFSVVLHFIIAILVGLVLIVPLYFFQSSIIPKQILLTNSIYFSCVGIGYILIQINLIQKYILYVGHPSYTLCLVLAGMLIFSGLGSLSSEKINLLKNQYLKSFILVALLPIIYLSVWIVPEILRENFYFNNFSIRSIFTILAIAPLSFILGIPFPNGLKFVNDNYPSLSPFAWAYNGWFSIIGAVLTTIISREYGYYYILTTSICVYVLVAAINIYWIKYSTK
jgi:hypothetical protein